MNAVRLSKHYIPNAGVVGSRCNAFSLLCARTNNDADA